MRILTFLFFIGLLTACQVSEVESSGTATTSLATESVIRLEPSAKDLALEFLLSAAAEDFMTHLPPEPLEFREVKLGQLSNTNNNTLYILCGEFLVEEVKGQFEWIEFATLKTSGYEQWLGTQANGLCQQPSIVWDAEGDLSALLMAQVNALR